MTRNFLIVLKKEYNAKQATCFANTSYTQEKGGGNSNPVLINVKCTYGLQWQLVLALSCYLSYGM